MLNKLILGLTLLAPALALAEVPAALEGQTLEFDHGGRGGDWHGGEHDRGGGGWNRGGERDRDGGWNRGGEHGGGWNHDRGDRDHWEHRGWDNDQRWRQWGHWHRGGWNGWGGGNGAPETELYCGNNNHSFLECRFNGHIQEAWVLEQFSNEVCIQDQTWGINDSGIWVNEGCQAQFHLVYLP